MQRFKDFTKKSGKVASAILSAAMVTSMVAGTNVVYAAEANTQAEDVKAIGTVEEANATVRMLADKLEAAYANPIVTAATTSGAFDLNTTKTDDYKKPADEIMKDYAGEYTAKLDYKVTTKPTDKKAGKATLEITVSTKNATTVGAKNPEDTRTIEIDLPSGKDRAETVANDIKTYLNDEIIITNTTTTGAIKAKLQKFISEEKVGAEKSISKYADVDASSLTVGTDRTGDTVTYTITGAVLKAIDNTAYNNDIDIEVETSKTIATAASMVKDAETNLPAYLANLKYFGSNVTSEGAIKIAIDEYLNDKYEGNVTAEIDKFTLNKKAEKINDGLATVSYTLKSTEKDMNGDAVASAKLENQKIKLASDDDAANQVMTDLKAAAAEVNVDSNTTNGYDKYQKELVEKFKEANKDVIVGKADEIKAVTGAAITDCDIEKISLVYGDKTTANVAFYPAGATADKDAKPNAVITVEVGDTKKVDTYAYDVASAATAVAQAQAAVEAAWNNMTFTNATTEADATAVAKEALKAYPTVKLAGDKVVFVKDEESRTITLNAILEDTRNGETKQANASKSYDYLSNEFVEKDGKKFYYDANGQLLKNTWLQGTDSPDGYTYYIQNDGSVMQDRLTYHPDGEHVIYFDKDGHEVFDAFVNVKADAQGNPVDYIGYFDTFGYAYVNQTTYGNGEGAYAKDALFYINDYGVLENKGWFQNAAGEIGYAAPNGTLTTSQWSLDQFGRKVYFQANGFLAKGLMTDGVKYYQLDETDGHLVGEF